MGFSICTPVVVLLYLSSILAKPAHPLQTIDCEKMQTLIVYRVDGVTLPFLQGRKKHFPLGENQ
jgi:hypothetical protein